MYLCDQKVVMRITSYYPVLATADVPGAQRFYQDLFGFSPRYVSDWYVHLAHPSHAWIALALVAADHETVPLAGRIPARGVLVNFEVDDAATEYERLSSAGVRVLVPIKDEAFGQRHFIIEGPDGVMIDVIEPIPPTEEFAAAYIGGSP